MDLKSNERKNVWNDAFLGTLYRHSSRNLYRYKWNILNLWIYHYIFRWKPKIKAKAIWSSALCYGNSFSSNRLQYFSILKLHVTVKLTSVFSDYSSTSSYAYVRLQCIILQLQVKKIFKFSMIIWGNSDPEFWHE